MDLERHLETHAAVWRPGGPVASWHAIGLPLVLAPVAGRVPSWVVRSFMVLITSVLAYHLFALVRGVTGASALAAGLGTIGVLASPPVIFHASLVYPEVLAGLLLVIALRCLASERPAWARLTGAGVAAALLPWFNARYGILTVGLGVLAVAHAWRAVPASPPLRRFVSTAGLLVGPALAGLAILGALLMFNVHLYGGLLPVSIPDDRYYSLRNLYVYGVGSLIGDPLGILPLAPLLMVALVAVPFSALWLSPRTVTAAGSVALAYWAFTGYFGSAGFTLPGRYLVAIVPLLAVPATVVLVRGGSAGRLAILIGAMLTMWSTATSARHLPDLYGPERRNIQPFGFTQSLWPIAIDETLELLETGLDGEAGGAGVGSEVGTIEQMSGATHLVAREGREGPGALSYGPYQRLRHGRYEASFEIVMEASQPVPPARVEAVDSGGRFLATADVPFPESGSRAATVRIQFETNGRLAIGLRVIYAGRGTLAMRRVTARFTEQLPRPSPEEDAWKAVLWVTGLAALSVAWRRRGVRSRTAV